ncbi:MAG TPA: DsbA family protein [Streptosporangiaceae bacterium]|nr:DsbA family protein [Streptosporangiaceae bacterium]
MVTADGAGSDGHAAAGRGPQPRPVALGRPRRHVVPCGLDTGQFTRDLRKQAGDAKIAADADSADLSRVSGTPTFFINGKRHHGAYDIGTLSDAVRAARARALVSSGARPQRAS